MEIFSIQSGSHLATAGRERRIRMGYKKLSIEKIWTGRRCGEGIDNYYFINEYNLNVIQFKVIAFLSSNAAGFVTGANVPVDSGHVNIRAGAKVYNE
jgi:hypothetical protein